MVRELVGRRLCAAFVLVVGAVTACGGEALQNAGDDDGVPEASGGTSGSASGGDANSGTSGTGASAGDASGGLPGAGGGSAGAGGSINIGGTGNSSGSSGSPECAACPAADYRIVVEGDGDAYSMLYNGQSEFFVRPTCPEQPIRGGVAGCGRSINLSACSAPMSGPPCLEVYRGVVRYLDARTGQIWHGTVTSDTPTLETAGVHSGRLAIALVGEELESTMNLVVEYTFCSALETLQIPC